MNAVSDDLFPLLLSLTFQDREERALIKNRAELERLLDQPGIRCLRVSNLAPQSATHLEIIARDRAARRLFEAHLGPARNCCLTPVQGQMHLCMEF